MAVSDKFDSQLPAQQSDWFKLADMAAKSRMVPKEYQGQPADCLVAMMMGAEIGLKPMQALQSICVINGRPSLWGTAARALVMASGLLESLAESAPDEVEKTKTAVCEIHRKGQAAPFIGQFSMDDARRAGLLGKDNYNKYPREMLAWRAFHQAARKAFPDIYKGLAAAEELQGSEPFQPAGESKITLQLDAPRDAIPAPESGQSERGVQAGATPVAAPKSRKKTQEPPAPKESSTPQEALTAVEGASPTQPEPCGFCHETGHTFNECPQQHSAADEVKATKEQRQALMRAASGLMGGEEGPRWVRGRLTALGCKTGADLTAAQQTALMKDLDEFRMSQPEPEDF